MGTRRMLSKQITETDMFIEMPLSTQALYMHLVMHAYDDGFISNPMTIKRMIGASDDDMRILLAKQLLIRFNNGVSVIRHWHILNTIRKDRYHQTIYQTELKSLNLDNGTYQFTNVGKSTFIRDGIPSDNQMATIGIPSGNQMETEVKLSKVNLSKVNKNILSKKSSTYDDKSIFMILAKQLFEQIKNNNDEAKQPNLQNWANDIRLTIERDKRKPDSLKKMIEWSQADNFWSGVILSPKSLRKNYDRMAAQANRQYKKRVIAKETLPDWAKQDAAKTKTIVSDPKKVKDINERLARFRKAKEN